MSTIENILADVSQLPVEARIELIDAIWDTIPQHSQPPISHEWLEEVQRRSAAQDANPEPPVTIDEFRATRRRTSGA
jgi:putative addiction module component (TIGR02574 family)